MAAVSPDWHFEDFTETSYREIVASARERYAFEPFGTATTSPHVLWRHDVDYSVHRAAALARIEADLGVRATYFVYCTATSIACWSPPSTPACARSPHSGTGLGSTSTRAFIRARISRARPHGSAHVLEK